MNRHRLRILGLNLFIDETARNLSATAAMVWMVLYRDTNWQNGKAQSAQGWIAERLGIQPRTVRSALAELEKKGLLTRKRGGTGHPSAYKIVPKRLD